MITVATAMALTGWSRRTIWRRLGDGTLVREAGSGADGGGAGVSLASLAAHMRVPLDQDELALIERADGGDPSTQTDLALVFLAKRAPDCAAYWLEQAARQDFADAMQLFGQCHLAGTGVARDANLGIMWIARAAASGHAIAQAQMQAGLQKPPGGR